MAVPWPSCRHSPFGHRFHGSSGVSLRPRVLDRHHHIDELGTSTFLELPDAFRWLTDGLRSRLRVRIQLAPASAASGIGRTTAIRFAAEGSAVVVADLNIDGGGFDKPQSIGFPAAQAALPAWVHFMTNSVREPSLGFGPPPPGIAAKRRKRADFVVLRG